MNKNPNQASQNRIILPNLLFVEWKYKRTTALCKFNLFLRTRSVFLSSWLTNRKNKSSATQNANLIKFSQFYLVDSAEVAIVQ